MKTHLLTFAGLLGLVAVTVALAFVPLGAGNLWIGLTLAGMQAALIAGIFMEWRQGDVPQRLALLVGFIWLSFLLILVGTDIGMRLPGTLLLH